MCHQHKRIEKPAGDYNCERTKPKPNRHSVRAFVTNCNALASASLALRRLAMSAANGATHGWRVKTAPTPSGARSCLLAGISTPLHLVWARNSCERCAKVFGQVINEPPRHSGRQSGAISGHSIVDPGGAFVTRKLQANPLSSPKGSSRQTELVWGECSFPAHIRSHRRQEANGRRKFVFIIEGRAGHPSHNSRPSQNGTYFAVVDCSFRLPPESRQ